MSYWKFTDEEKLFIDEISALSGIQKEVIREVLEFIFIRCAEKIAQNPQRMNVIQIPHLGTIGIRYEKDVLLEDGSVDTELNTFFSPSQQLKRLVGDIVDEKESIVISLLKKKIESSLVALANAETN